MDYRELIERLRQYNGVVECRVQHPKTGNYCISFDWHDSFNPKRNADEWLADQKKRFPENEYSTTYVVKEVCVLSKQDEACHEAADAVESLLTKMQLCHDAIKKLLVKANEGIYPPPCPSGHFPELHSLD